MAGDPELYIGLMSGTSLDAIDAVAVHFTEPGHSNQATLVATLEKAFPDKLHTAIQSLVISPQTDLDSLGRLHRQLGLVYAETVQELLADNSIKNSAVRAIGCHGQTIRHSPDTTPAFTMQIGDAATIANECSIATVADFRSADMALGGEGAPLVPAFHQWAFADPTADSVIANIGGIANITVLAPGRPVAGFDTGPGNTLLDTWFRRNHDAAYDAGGQWAAGGSVLPDLLQLLESDPYFARQSPKSTGREYFNAEWLQQHLGRFAAADPQNIQSTLAELSARTIARAIGEHCERGAVWVCGGGSFNADLMNRLRTNLPEFTVADTSAKGVPPEWVEATAFAWLARERMHERPAGMPDVTGARTAGTLGAVHIPAIA